MLRPYRTKTQRVKFKAEREARAVARAEAVVAVEGAVMVHPVVRGRRIGTRDGMLISTWMVFTGYFINAF
jgi:hypothetical protein